MSRRVPTGPPPPPVVARIRLRYAKRGRLRFTSHRDFARAFERALRRAGIPMAYSAGFSPHPKISYVGAAPTGVASEAEYLEIGLAEPMPPEQVRAALDAALPDGLDIVEAVPAGPGGLAERMQAAQWQLTLTGASGVEEAVAAFLTADQVVVPRLTKDGTRDIDARAPIVRLTVSQRPDDPTRAILDLVVRLVTPAVRPDDVLAALTAVGGLHHPDPLVAVRLSQGPLAADGSVGDPLADDRAASAAAARPS